MTKSRLEAFSDGVIAIIITVMVLELRAPEGTSLRSLAPLWPVFLSYAFSFVFLGIYWSNHHHLFQAVRTIKGGVLWANLHLLFWLSLTPWATGWMGEHAFAAVPVAVYGVLLLGAAVAYFILVKTLLVHHEPDSELALAIGKDFKGKVSMAIYALGIPASLVYPWLGLGLYGSVSVIWLVPDRRIERTLGHRDEGREGGP